MADQPGTLSEECRVLSLRVLPPWYRAEGNCPPPGHGAWAQHEGAAVFGYVE